MLETAFNDLPGAMDHPGLLHLHVHLMEMSPHPEAALVTGDRLRELTPDMGHLTHMPTHIDIQCGHYRDAMLWNQKAIVADRKFYDRAGPMNFYSGYRVHNYHFAAYGAMFLGQYASAITAADELIETMPEEMLRIPSPPMADFFESYASIRQHVLIRFGKWHEIIAQELPIDRELYCNATAMIHYAKGVAHAALGEVPAAEAEQALFRDAANQVPKSRYLHNVPCTQLLAVAEEMLEGEIAYRRGEHEAAFTHLRAAVALEDELPYDEPWGWMQPVRHALGALLLEQGRAAEAEIVYREDLGLGGSAGRCLAAPTNSPTIAPTIAKPKLTCRLAKIQLIADGMTTDVVTCRCEAPRICALAIMSRSASRTPWKALAKTTKNTITKASATFEAMPRPSA